MHLQAYANHYRIAKGGQKKKKGEKIINQAEIPSVPLLQQHSHCQLLSTYTHTQKKKHSGGLLPQPQNRQLPSLDPGGLLQNTRPPKSTACF